MTDLTAITRKPPASMAECALTFIDRQPINIETVRTEHQAYEHQLRVLGAIVVSLPAQDTMPDSVFVEDTAIVFDELAVITKPALLSRQPETDSIFTALRLLRTLHAISGEARLEGGDVLVIGRTVLVGRSSRTNDEGIRQLAQFIETHGYSVTPIDVTGCLHLKTGVTHVGGDTVVANTRWFDAERLNGFRVLEVHPDEPSASNVLRIGNTAVIPANFPRTRDLIEAAGIRTATIESSELQKAESGLTCCSLVFRSPPDDRVE